MKYLFCALTLFGTLASGGTLFIGAYPDSIMVFDEAKGQVIDRIPLSTGLPMSMKLSDDKKRIYVTTNDHSGIEVIDVASRRVIQHFVLNTATTRYRFNGGIADPDGHLFYTVITEIDKRLEHYEVGKPQYAVIDLAQQKIVKTVPVAPEDENANSGYGRGFEISPDASICVSSATAWSFSAPPISRWWTALRYPSPNSTGKWRTSASALLSTPSANRDNTYRCLILQIRLSITASSASPASI